MSDGMAIGMRLGTAMGIEAGKKISRLYVHWDAIGYDSGDE